MAAKHIGSRIAASAFLAAAFASFGLGAAENLVPGGDFTEAKKGKIDWCRREGGAFSLFTEDYTWNNCGKLEIRETYTNGVTRKRAASVTIGRDGKFNGFAVKPDTTYDFSIDLRGGGGVGAARVHALAWHGDDYWKDRKSVKTTPSSSVTLEPSWMAVKGSFKTPSDAKRAALQVTIWSSTEYGGTLYEPGSFVLIDNVKVEESKNNLAAFASAPGAGGKVPVRKAIATGGTFGDFVDLREASKPAGAPTKVSVAAEKDAFAFEIVCADPQGVSAKEGGSVWSGDVVEIWFGAVGEERQSSQFCVGANGARYASANGETRGLETFSAEVTRGETEWTARVRIPFASIGWTAAAKAGDSVGFNVGRYRMKARQYVTWSPLKQGFNDTAHYGELVLGDYAAALKRRFGIEGRCATREDYEAQVAAAETAAREAKFAKFRNKRFSVAPVPVTSDFAVPFLPAEIFDPPETIRLTAAINERKALPVAIANLADRAEDYVVLLETAEKPLVGAFGLKGFPADRITVRKALRMKDSNGKEPTLRLDPLPTMDLANTVTVPPKEAGLVWFDFDTTDVPAGRYAGRLRVIPLGGYGAFKQGKGYSNITYSGDMQDLPVELEVRPITLPRRAAIPTGFFMAGLTEEAFGYQAQLGAEYFNVSPWSFSYERTPEGDLDLDRPTAKAQELAETVRKHLRWGEALGFRTKFLVGYSAVYVFHNLYNPKKDPAKDARLWPQYVKGIQKLMNSCGVPDTDYALETYDEPPADDYAGIRAFHEAAKKVAPTMRLEITLGHRKMTIEELRRLGEVTDEWIVWDSYFTTAGYAELFREQAALGKTIRHYECDTSPRAGLDTYFRKKAWFGEKHRLHGNCMYQFHDQQGGIGGRDFKTPTTGGIGYFVYGRFIPSIRFMAFREGVTDMKYFARLREIAPGDKAVEAFVADAVNRALGTRKHDPAEPDRLRERAAQMILERMTTQKEK